MTTAKATLTVGGKTYPPKTLQRSAYALDSLGRKNNISIMFPGNDQFARGYITPTTIALTVDIANLMGHIFFRGRLISTAYNTQSNLIKMVFEPTIRLDRRAMGERRLFQIDCNYLVYDSNCGATKVNHAVRVTAIRNDLAVQLRFDTNDPVNDAKVGRARFDVFPTPIGRANLGAFLGGLLDNANATPPTRWWITNVTNPVATGRFVFFDVTLFRPHFGLSVGNQVTVSFGCKRTIGDCHSLFNNRPRYGGFVALTKQSPFDGGFQ